MAENVPKLMAYTKEHTHEAQRTPSRINTKKKKKKISSQAQHIQSIESQRQKTKEKSWKNPENKYIFPTEAKVLVILINFLSSINSPVNFCILLMWTGCWEGGSQTSAMCHYIMVYYPNLSQYTEKASGKFPLNGQWTYLHLLGNIFFLIFAFTLSHLSPFRQPLECSMSPEEDNAEYTGIKKCQFFGFLYSTQKPNIRQKFYEKKWPDRAMLTTKEIKRMKR